MGTLDELIVYSYSEVGHSVTLSCWKCESQHSTSCPFS